MVENAAGVKLEKCPDFSIENDFDNFMAEMESGSGFFPRKRKSSESSLFGSDPGLGNSPRKLNKSETSENIQIPLMDGPSLPSLSASPDISPFESAGQSETSVSTQEAGENPIIAEEKKQVQFIQPNFETVATLKRSMASYSRLIGTFTALKTTYLKLCKEFNFLLGKFNENERIKIELIHENNELRALLWETIKEKELDRKKYKNELRELGKK